MMSDFEEINGADAKLFLRKVSKELPFSTVVVRKLYGGYYTANGGDINLDDPKQFFVSVNVNKSVSGIYRNALYDRDMIALTSPIYKDRRIVGYISGLYYTNYIHNILNDAAEDKNHNYHIIQKNGDYVLYTEPFDQHNHDNLYEFLDHVDFDNEFELAFVEESLKNNKTGVSSYSYNGNANYICYTPIGINDWYLIANAPDDSRSMRTFTIKNPTISLSLKIILLFTFLLIYILYKHTRYKRDMEVKNYELEDLNERLEKKNENLKIKAEKDQLTGLYNKITSEKMIDGFLYSQGRKSRHALVVIDIDNFKYFNDELGHLTGDKVLAEVAKAVDLNFRTSDIKGRIGGDEFIILLKDAVSDEKINEKASNFIKLLKAILINGESAGVSCSIGIAIYPQHGGNYKELFLRADKAMYHSKEMGKDRFYVYKDNIE